MATASPTAAAIPTSSAAAGITGNWTGIWQDSKHSTINGSFQVTLTQSGSTLSGTIEITNSCVGNGTVDGSIEPSGAISFGAVKGNATVTFTGQVSGDSMSGDYTAPGEACGNGAGTWTATRD